MIDLLYFIYTSADIETRFEKVHELLDLYHEKLSRCLVQVGLSSRIPSMEQMKLEWERKYFHGEFFK